jgi:hypothetical protein
MNWTGGRLSRHSRNANSSLNQRQKQHFAKVRSGLLNGPQKRSPMRWSIFEKDDGTARVEGSKLYITPPPAPMYQPDFGPNDEGISKRGHRSENSSNSALPQATFSRNKGSGRGRESHKELLGHGGSGHDFHQGALPSLDTETGKQKVPNMEIADDVNIGDEADSFEERRRRILRRIDWVGANIQHPIKLKFTAPGNDDGIGKRRKITAHHQNQFSAMAQPMIMAQSPMPKSKEKPHGLLGARSMRGKINEALPKNHVRISIGGRPVAAGVSSSTSHHSKTVGGRFSSSDEMLLDGDDISRQHRQFPQERQVYLSYPASPSFASSTMFGNTSTFSASPKDLPIRTPHRRQVLSSYGRSKLAIHRHTAAPCVNLKGRVSSSRSGEDSSTLDVAQHLDKRLNHLVHSKGRLAENTATLHSNLVTVRSHTARSLPDITSRVHADVTQVLDLEANLESLPSNPCYVTGVSKQLSESTIKLQAVAQDKSRRINRFDSQPELLHPIPLSSRTLRVLCTTSSEAGSNVAQIDMEPAATRSQVLDEEIWKTWVLSPGGDLSNESHNEMYEDVCISPGISNYGRQVAQRNLDDPIERDKNNLEMLQGLALPDHASGQESEQTGKSPTDVKKEEIHREIRPSSQEYVDYPRTMPVIDYKSLFLSRARKLPSQSKPKPVRVANRNEAWMRFILSDNDDNDEEDNLHALVPQPVIPLPSPVQRRPSSSMIANFSVKTASSCQLEPSTALNSANRNTTISSIDELQVSNHTTEGSNPSSSDDVSFPPSSVDQIRTEPASSFSTSSRPIRKLTFTRPPRFQVPNRGSSPEATAATAGSPIHIGKAFAVATLRGRGGMAQRERRQERDIYNNGNEDDVESIEDI